MRTLIVLGGDAPKKELLRACAGEADLTIAADRGLEAFDAADIEPDLLIGDMDSIRPDILARYEGKLEERRLNCIKDDTDGVDALDVALKRGATEITFLARWAGGSITRLPMSCCLSAPIVREPKRVSFRRMRRFGASMVKPFCEA